MENQRSKADMNFSLNISPEVFNAMPKSQQEQLAGNYLQQIQNVIMGAIVAGATSLDFVMKINLNVLSHINISEDLLKIAKTKNLIVSVVFVGTGEGRVFL